MATTTEAEVRSVLRDRGLTPAVIEQVLVRYRASSASGGMSQWNDDQVNDWLNNQIRNLGVPRRFGGVSDSANAMVEAQQDNDTDFDVVSQMAREAAEQRQQQIQNRVFEGARIDHGSMWDPSTIANSLGEGVWMDDTGQYINPTDGSPTDVPVPIDVNTLWQEIKHQSFNMGSLSMPGFTSDQAREHAGPGSQGGMMIPGGYGYTGNEKSKRVPGEDRKRRYVTPSMALSLLDNMSEPYLVQLQQQMFQAGLYPEESRPDWGEADMATREAFRGLFVEASMNPRAPINTVLRDLIDRRLNSQEMTPGSPGAGGIQGIVDMPTLELPDFQPSVMNEEAARQGLEDVAKDLLGEKATPEQMNTFVAKLREMEVGAQRSQYDSDVTRIRDAYDLQVQGVREGAQYQQQFGQGGQGGGGGQAPADVDAFLAAISGQESGGNYDAHNPSGAHGKYQFMPATWSSYARRAGLGAGAPMTPENQELVARQMAMDLYSQFGSWRDVAIAWYAGPGAVDNSQSSLNAGQDGYPSINSYADSIMQKMGQTQRGAGGPTGLIEIGGGQVGGNILDPIEQFDPAAEMAALVKASDPAGYQANEWGDRAQEFFGALSGVIGGGAS